ncbi:hypothetical protein EYF80_051848 [Liparis tanakae]|uniref:Uncharacterized protein n=1 Tax=Liparis tanakae TaxID=230148 RepID=A0A4Z2FB43_9TELE|nr:hypothetical protein EYF80_051848 [Liparis tanakae]
MSLKKACARSSSQQPFLKPSLWSTSLASSASQSDFECSLKLSGLWETQVSRLVRSQRSSASQYDIIDPDESHLVSRRILWSEFCLPLAPQRDPDDPLLVEVLQALDDLGDVETGSGLVEARVVLIHQADTSPNPPLPSTRKSRNQSASMGCISSHFHCRYLFKYKLSRKEA